MKVVDLFNAFEKRGFDYENNVHIFILHYMFFDRIQEELDDFKGGWNHHKLSSEINKSPLQLMATRYDINEIDVVYDDDDYGAEDLVDYVENDQEEDIDNQVVVEPIKCAFENIEKFNYFKTHVSCFTLNEPLDNLIDNFMLSLNFTLDIINS
jgi:hypothetical protein